ncbi:hypothetical protein QYM36_011668 [Artemia franciscana]|uniref:Galactose-3-O-sulfotransferase n=1 Tax=Artemia franciscana TaxID=6661 RepID=A0AA88L9E7_ARTSF|nr:hypothetical protein QYM36_011668 [Artemia franciscana]
MKIGFVKSFKVSGTTMADILLKISYFYGNFYDHVTESIVFKNIDPAIDGKISKFDILVKETWKINDFEKMLGNEFVSLTILRNPVKQFESMFAYMDMRHFYNVSSFKKFLDKLELGAIKEERFMHLYGRNQLSFSLGLEPKFFDNETAIESFINVIDSQFQLVMISEYFDESVILLKNLIGTHIGQMLYVKQLPRKKETKHEVTDKQKKILEKWLKADLRLYEAFKMKLLNSLTKKTKEEARILQQFNAKFQTFCEVSALDFSFTKNHSERFGLIEIQLIKSNRSNMLCDLYIGDIQDKFRHVPRAVKDFGEVQRLFMI